MAYCVKCNQQIDSSAFCPHCGAAQQPQPAQTVGQPMGQPVPQPAPSPYPYQTPTTYAYPAPAVKDSGSFGWAVLGFCFPIVGFILYLVWKNTKPRCARRAGKGALISFVIGLAVNALSTCAYMLL